jgi:uncharacterized HAD superfamily protein
MAYYEDGLEVNEIASKFEVTPQAVYDKLQFFEELGYKDKTLLVQRILEQCPAFAEDPYVELVEAIVDEFLYGLRRIWEMEEHFQRLVYPDFGRFSDKRKMDITKDLLLGLLAESKEFTDAMGEWRPHRFTSEEARTSGILEECVDMMKYLLAILIIRGVEYRDFRRKIWLKSKVVEERFKWEFEIRNLKPEDKVCAVDLDGVLCRYPENWIHFLNQKLGLTAERPILLSDFTFTSAPLPNIPRKKYYQWKHEFRELGFESYFGVEPMEEASEFTKKLKDLGYKIIILSARPYKEYKRIMADTIEWLHKNNISYDAVYWDSEKHVRILKDVPFLKFMVEDNPQIAMEVSSLGYKCFLINRPYNMHTLIPSDIVRINKLVDIIPHLQEAQS